jgi:hypothetical protein
MLDRLQQMPHRDLHLQNADLASTIPAPAGAAACAAFCSDAPAQAHSRGVWIFPHPNCLRAPPISASSSASPDPPARLPRLPPPRGRPRALFPHAAPARLASLHPAAAPAPSPSRAEPASGGGDGDGAVGGGPEVLAELEAG